MTKLEKFLLERSSEMIKSDTTNSRYFKIGNITIRLSDHISLKTSSDIQIIIPTNHLVSGLYTVIFGDSGKVLIWNAKQIQEFIPSLILIKEMSTKSIFKTEINKTTSSVQKIEMAKQMPESVTTSLVFTKRVDSKIREKFAGHLERAVLRRSKSPWNAQEIGILNVMIRKEFGRGDSINDDFQIFLNCTALNYIDVINIYKIVVIDNEKMPTIQLLQEAYNIIK